MYYKILYRIYEVCSKSNQMNEDLSLASHLQLEADNMCETLSESLDSQGKNPRLEVFKEPDLF